MVENGEGSFKKPGAVPFNWEIRPGLPKIRTSKPDDGSTLLQPPKKLPPLLLKQLPPSPPSSSPSLSPFAPPPPPPPSSFKLKPRPDSSGPPTPYWRSSSVRATLHSGSSLRRWNLLKSLLRFKKSKSRDVKCNGVDSTTSLEADVFYDSETTNTTTFSPSLSSFRRGQTLKRNESDLSSSEKRIILMMSRDRLR